MQRGTVPMVVVLAACATPPRPPPIKPPEPPHARIEVSDAACPTPIDAQPKLARVLATHHAERSDLVIRVSASTVDAETNHLHLVVERSNGEVGLDRKYTLVPSDCASAADLLALGVDRFLSAFPEWAGPPRPPPPPPPPPSRWVDVTFVSALSSIWMPFGVDGQAGTVVDIGAERHRFGGSAIVRASIPQAAGNGRFQQTALLVGATYRHRTGPWALRVEARGGALLVSGVGYAENASDWLPWWEGAVYGGRALGWGAVGVELAVTGLRHHAVTRDGLVEEDIPSVRLGLALEFGVASKK